MKSNQSWLEVKKQLKYCSERDLLGLVQELYKLNSINKEYLNAKFLAGINLQQKDEFIKEIINTIRTLWQKSFHDPYGYGGGVVRVKISPIKAPLVTYKKAVGVDGGYIAVLAEYIIYGQIFLERNCAEMSDTALNSINSVAKELFVLLANEDKYINSLSSKQLENIQVFIASYYAKNIALVAYKDVENLITNTLKNSSKF
ncbi:hypothetical protein TUM4438_45910 [Shewanella sairae]|uniref:Uncharacterized protein n=2 Tax=Shewanella sairae TaxID=190310 RepID=A0ABQ4PRW5_9GAMM|nr:hypothetical protein [Shewanella sairae]GIU52660.1 hypothetical protein TUM4438_45910 [Shewanella sairae]